jgi:hypothetical protein
MNCFGDALKKGRANKMIVSKILDWAQNSIEAQSYLYDTSGDVLEKFVGENIILNEVIVGCKQYLEECF